jgi:hypothetical protein
LLVLARTNGNELELIQSPPNPVAFLPFTEAVTLGEYSQTSLFCGHIVISLKLDKIVKVKRHLYIHDPLALSISAVGCAAIILIFENALDAIAAEKLFSVKTQAYAEILPSYRFYFTYSNLQTATNHWTNNVISNLDYLLILNFFSGRSYSDLSQYPVVPWACSPQLEPRDLSKPMGQLADNRALHFDQTYELSQPHYFYGFHYSLPGAVFWLLMRLPPFTYFQWDLNEGWDDSQRLFTSIMDAWQSAAVMNPSDLKELVPQMYSTPEALVNSSGLNLSDGINPRVSLPAWTADNANFYIEASLKSLNSAQSVNRWVDLIFGYKQTGQTAIDSKNVFLPSSYHTAKAADLEMEPEAFASQVLNFGQCPVQLFPKKHPAKSERVYLSLEDVSQKMKSGALELLNPLNLAAFQIVPISDKIGLALPRSAVVGMLKTGGHGCYFHWSADEETLSVFDLATQKPIYVKMSADFAFVSDLSVSHDGLFLAVSFEFGTVDINQIVYDKGTPTEVHRFASFSERAKCFASVVLSSDFICASSFHVRVILWNIATQLRHREISLDFLTTKLHFDHFGAILSLIGTREVSQYSVNGQRLHTISLQSKISAFAFMPVDFSFDRRLIVLGHTDGVISFLAVDPIDYKLKVIGRKPVHNCAIVSLFVELSSLRLTSCDERGVIFQSEFDILDPISVVQRCQFCSSFQTEVCAKCQSPMCDYCASDGNDLCFNCAHNARGRDEPRLSFLKIGDPT